MDHNSSKKYEDPSIIVMDWLKSKMKARFERDFNLDEEVVITAGDQIRVSLTPDTSKLSQPESLGFSLYVNYVNSNEVNLEELLSETEQLK